MCAKDLRYLRTVGNACHHFSTVVGVEVFKCNFPKENVPFTAAIFEWRQTHFKTSSEKTKTRSIAQITLKVSRKMCVLNFVGLTFLKTYSINKEFILFYITGLWSLWLHQKPQL